MSLASTVWNERTFLCEWLRCKVSNFEQLYGICGYYDIFIQKITYETETDESVKKTDPKTTIKTFKFCVAFDFASRFLPLF